MVRARFPCRIQSIVLDPGIYSNGAEALFAPQSYHGQDYDFFYMNIRENAGDRIEAFLSG